MLLNTFDGNSASAKGGRIRNSEGTVTMSHCTFLQADGGYILSGTTFVSTRFVMDNSLVANTGTTTNGPICDSGFFMEVTISLVIHLVKTLRLQAQL